MIQRLLNKLSKLSNFWAGLILVVLGFVTYSNGLNNPFEEDDIDQIVKSLPVHSLKNIKLFFEGGTFYTGRGLQPLSGPYYRPLMTTVFSFIYSLFGPHPFYFRLCELIIFILVTILVYIVLRYSFNPSLALFLAAIFLVHPIDSQIVYALPSLQDDLFMLFGMLAIWSLIRFKSVKALWLSGLFLVLSLFSKESAILFVVIAAVYLFWWDRQRLKWFAGILVIPFVSWVYLRIHAVGFLINPDSAPIDKLSLISRIFTAPSIMLFYLSKVVFPWKLATTYYWTYSTFSVSHCLVPLLVDMAFLALIVYFGLIIRRHSTKSMLYSYMFFGVWFLIGLGLIMQLMALDMTACEIWFCFPFVGLLGMLGVILSSLKLKFNPKWLFVVAILIVSLLAFRTAIRALDYRTPQRLALSDIANSPDNIHADSTLTDIYMGQNNFGQAKPYVQNAIGVFPNFGEYINLAAIDINLQDYAAARAAYISSLSYSSPDLLPTAYEGMASLSLLTAHYSSNKSFLLQAVKAYPNNSVIWTDLAIFEAIHNDNADAKIAINNAARNGQVSASLYYEISSNTPFNIQVAGRTIAIP